MKKILTIIVIFFYIQCSLAKTASDQFDQHIHDILQEHYQKYKQQEYFSGASLSIYYPEQKIRNYYIGKISHASNSKNVSSQTLFQIGSITKSFTSAVILQLEKEGYLNLTMKIGQWLPEYEKWSAVPIKDLLNMTSGIPNYCGSHLWNTKVHNDLSHHWTTSELIDFVYPRSEFSPPLKSGYYYSNTGYLLTALVVEKVTGKSFYDQILNRAIKPAHLNNTFYDFSDKSSAINNRLAHGHFYDQYENTLFLGEDVYKNNLSWAAAAGGVISTSEDIVKWVKALFCENEILDAHQQRKLMQLVSTKSGKPIERTNEEDPEGFGLGIAQAYDNDKQLGQYWYYEGSTLGFRAIYLYKPENGIIIACVFNSVTNLENDHALILLKKIYKFMLSQNQHA